MPFCSPLSKLPGVLVLNILIFLPPSAPDREKGIGNQPGKEERPIKAADRTLPGQSSHKHRRRNHNRDINPHKLLRYHERGYRSRDAEDEEDIEQIASDNIAKGEVGLSSERCHHAEGGL